MVNVTPDVYDGREHADVKHFLLKSYLERYLLILGRTRQRMCYVDAFSGPWQSAAEDHADTSFGLARATAAGCSSTLAAADKYPKIRQLWLEADSEAYSRLSAFAAARSTNKISLETQPGRFEDNVAAIAQWIGDDDAFVLIDPKGYKGLIEPDVLAPLLAMPRVEVLINYMWQFIDYAARQMNQPGNLENLKRLFGSDCADIERISHSEEREKRYIERYEQRLRDHGIVSGSRRSRVLSFPIHHVDRKDRAKYYLVYTTHSSKGLITFADSADTAADKQQQVHFATHHRRRAAKSGIEDMFGGGHEAKELAGELVEPWLTGMPLPGSELQVTEEVWATMIEENRCRPSELQNGLKALVKDGIIENVTAKGKRKTRYVHHESAELLRRLQ